MGEQLQRAKWKIGTKNLLAVGWRQSRHKVTTGGIAAAQKSAQGVRLDVLLFGKEHVKLLLAVFPQGHAVGSGRALLMLGRGKRVICDEFSDHSIEITSCVLLKDFRKS